MTCQRKSLSEVSVDYDRKSPVYNGCKALGHLISECPYTRRIWVQKTPPFSGDDEASNKQEDSAKTSANALLRAANSSTPANVDKGDSNTSFFHKKIASNWNHNKILSLTDQNGLHSVDSVIYEAEVGATWRELRETRHEEIEEMRRLREGRMVFIESHGSVML
ncbi:hypothetical protein ACET3Z_025434 [Daucus carota]